MLNNEDLTPAVETRRLPLARSPFRADAARCPPGEVQHGDARLRAAEVNAFLLEAADGYEQALRENERLRQEVARLEASLDASTASSKARSRAR